MTVILTDIDIPKACHVYDEATDYAQMCPLYDCCKKRNTIRVNFKPEDCPIKSPETMLTEMSNLLDKSDYDSKEERIAFSHGITSCLAICNQHLMPQTTNVKMVDDTTTFEYKDDKDKQMHINMFIKYGYKIMSEDYLENTELNKGVKLVYKPLNAEPAVLTPNIS